MPNCLLLMRCPSFSFLFTDVAMCQVRRSQQHPSSSIFASVSCPGNYPAARRVCCTVYIAVVAPSSRGRAALQRSLKHFLSMYFCST